VSLVDTSRTPGNGQVYDVNSYALAAAGRDAGAEVNRVGIVDTEATNCGKYVEGQLNRAEVVVIAGAVGGAARRGRQGGARATRRMEVTRIRCTPARCRASANSAQKCAGFPPACQPGERTWWSSR